MSDMTDGRRSAVRVVITKLLIIAAVAACVLALGLLTRGYGTCKGTPEQCAVNFTPFRDM